MRVCPGLTRLHQTAIEGQPGLPGRKPDPSCNSPHVCCALETDRCPHTGVAKVRLTPKGILVRHSLGGGAEHAQSQCHPESIFGAERDVESNATEVRA